jgi:hypothetical protein
VEQAVDCSLLRHTMASRPLFGEGDRLIFRGFQRKAAFYPLPFDFGIFFAPLLEWIDFRSTIC